MKVVISIPIRYFEKIFFPEQNPQKNTTKTFI